MRNIYKVVNDPIKYITSREIRQRKNVGRMTVSLYAKRFKWKKYVYRGMHAFERKIVEDYIENSMEEKYLYPKQDEIPAGCITRKEMVNLFEQAAIKWAFHSTWKLRRRTIKRVIPTSYGFYALKNINTYFVEDLLKRKKSKIAKLLESVAEKFWEQKRMDDWSPANNKNNSK